MAGPKKNVLFLCTGNSCRSIIAEALLNHLGGGRYRAFSAGSHAAGSVNPRALAALARRGVPAPEARSKAWDEFAAAGAPAMDFIITVCDNAAGEACPVWPGRPATAHWGVPDPALFDGSDRQAEAVFDATLKVLEARIAAFVALPPAALAGPDAKRRLAGIAIIG